MSSRGKRTRNRARRTVWVRRSDNDLNEADQYLRHWTRCVLMMLGKGEARFHPSLCLIPTGAHIVIGKGCLTIVSGAACH